MSFSRSLLRHKGLWAFLFIGLGMGCSQRTLDLLGRSFVPMHLTAQQVTDSTYHQVILPGYRTFTQQAQALHTAVQALAQSPQDATLLTQAQEAWQAASEAWVLTEAYQFGPATEERLRQNIAFWPRRTDHITRVLTETTPIQIQQLGTSRKGLPVMEYLLFHERDAFASAAAARHVAYLKVLSQDLVTQAQALQTAWEGEYGASYLSSANAQNMQLNQWVVLLENIKNKRLGNPAGLLDGQATGLETLEAPDSQVSLPLLKAAIAGFSQNYALEGLKTQSNVPDTAEYVVALGHREVHAQILAQTQVVRQSFTALEPSLERALTEKPEAVAESYEAIKTLLRLVKVDLANALNQTVNFTDNDGD